MAKHKIVTKEDWVVTDIPAFVTKFYEDNPFYPVWPFGQLTPQHMENIVSDNMWFRSARTRKNLEQAEEAPL